MSNTFKDKPYKVRYSEEYLDWQKKEPYPSKTLRTKKRKELDTEMHWMTTPSWHNRLHFTRPQRRKANMATHTLPTKLADVDIPDCGYKPHIYYW